jgi:hypothetical protein
VGLAQQYLGKYSVIYNIVYAYKYWAAVRAVIINRWFQIITIYIEHISMRYCTLARASLIPHPLYVVRLSATASTYFGSVFYYYLISISKVCASSRALHVS